MHPFVGSERLSAQGQVLSDALEQQAARFLAPDTRKSDKPLRRFLIREAATALRLNYNSFRHYLKTVPDLPAGTIESGNRRTFSLEEVHEIQSKLYTAGKIPVDLFPRRGPDDQLSVISVFQLKGGVAKSTLAVNLAAFLAWRGYRVLAIDVDPQSSLSDVFDVKPDLDGSASLYDVMRTVDPIPITDAIQSTYYPNLDILPGSLSMTEFEYETAASFRKVKGQGGAPWHKRFTQALDLVDSSYDVVIVDTPPHLSFSVLSAVHASTGLLMPFSPGMLDIVSLQKFLFLASDTLAAIEAHEPDKRYDFMRYVMTRYNPNDAAQLQIWTFMKAHFGSSLMDTPFLQSTAIADAGNTTETLIEVRPSEFNRKTYDRIFESLQSIVHDLEDDIMRAWGRIDNEEAA